MGNYSKKDKDQKGDVGTSKAQIISDVLTTNMSSNPTNAMPSTPKHGGRLLKSTGNKDKPYVAINSTPGAMRIWFLPVIASTDDMTKASTLSQVASNIWNSLRTYCTTAQNYQPGDVLQAFIQLAQFPFALAKIKRQMASLYCKAELKNFYKNDMWRMFLDINSTKNAEIAALDGNMKKYNSIVRQFNEICMPDIFPIFHRWEAMVSKVFRDIDDDDVAQLFFFDTNTFYVTHLADPDHIPGAEMQPKSLAGTITINLEQLQTWMQTLYDDASIRDIVADVTETFSDKTFYKVKEITYDDIKDGIQTEYDPEVLFALYNATMLPVMPPTVNVVPESGGIVGKYIPGRAEETQYQRNFSVEGFRIPKLFNAQEWNTPVERFIKSTVWTISEPSLNATNGLQTVVGEILTYADIYYYAYELGASHASWHVAQDFTNFSWVTIKENQTSTTPIWTQENWTNFFHKLGTISSFAWAPMLYLLSGTSVGDSIMTINIEGIVAELEHPVFLDTDDLESWHDTARMGLWGLPIPIEPKTR